MHFHSCISSIQFNFHFQIKENGMTLKHLMSSVLILLTLTAGVACAETNRSESAGQYIDSSVLTNKVIAQLANDPYVNSAPIKVKTYKSVVQLSGFADSVSQKNRAGYIASQVSGVESVKNNITVKKSTSETAGQYIDSSVLTAKVMAQLANDPYVKSLPIKVKSYKNTVQLSGFVDSYSQKRRAAYVVSQIDGVESVKNNLIVKH
jgi:hyperosmotically inducible periplasmic protein